MNKIAFFVLIFLFCTALGLYVGVQSIPQVGEINPLTGQSVNDVSGTLYFLMVVLVGTTVLLLVLRYYKGWLLYKLFEIYVIFVGSMVVWQFLLADIINGANLPVDQNTYLILTFIVSALMVAIRQLNKGYFVLNVTLAIAISGAVGVLGSFMGFVPALLLVIALSIYDFIAVFKTKHMVKLADQSRIRDLPVMFEIPSKGIRTGPRKAAGKGEDKSAKRGSHVDLLGLGTGDIAIPVIFFVGILRTFNDWLFVGGAVVGAMAGLALTIYYVTNVRRIALPALPPIISSSILGLGISMLIGSFL